ncbi:MAG: hypothetical protein IPJ04_18615 [Candidatus Eisenbacteria bacterium]|nr:hypothetical protein [Candidatus Eisenbacteria bacterium]
MAELLGPSVLTFEEVREVVTQELAALLGYDETAPAAIFETLHALLA